MDSETTYRLVRILRETGRLSASVRQIRPQERTASAQMVPEGPAGAIPTPGANAANVEQGAEADLTNLQTPNERARLRQRQALCDRDLTQQRVTHV